MKNKLLKIILPIAVFIILCTSLILILIPKNTSVPDVVGEKFDKASQYFSEAGIKINMKEEYSFTIPKGDIISQNTSPDTKIKKGETVTVVVSLGIEQVIVPDLSGKTLIEATDTLQSVDLNINSIEEYDFNVEKGKIISQSIDAGTKTDKESIINVIVSKGIEQVSVPSLTGKTLDEASAILSSAGLTLTSEIEFTDKIAEGNIISQSLAANQVVNKGSVLSVKVSAGPANVYGNTSANINNEGYAAQQGNWIYYIANSSLYKIRTDGTQKTRLNINKDVCGYINVVAEWIYFTDYSMNIYKVRIDGTGLKRVLNDQVNTMIVIGDYIYYHRLVNGGSEYIYRIRTDGTDKTQITNVTCTNFDIAGDWIYYSGYNAQRGGYDLFKIRTDGTNETFLKEGMGFSYINVINGSIYCQKLDSNASLCKVNINNLSEQTVLNEHLFRINIVGDWIYYMDIEASHNLYKIKLDGTGRTNLLNKYCVAANIVDGWIYYRLNASTEIYKMRTDGTDNQLLG